MPASESMASIQPIVLDTSNLLQFMQHVLNYHASPSTLIVCSTKAAFLESLQHAVNAPTEDIPAEHRDSITRLKRLWRTPSLRLISTSQTLKLVFCPDITHLRACLATHSLKVAQRVDEVDTALRYNNVQAILAILNLVEIHRPTTAFSAQGLNRTISGAVEAAHATDSRLILAECIMEGQVNLEPPFDIDADAHHINRGISQVAWDEEVPILNVTTKRLGELSVGRTVPADSPGIDSAVPNIAVEDDGRWNAFDPSMSMAQKDVKSRVNGDLSAVLPESTLEQAVSVLEHSGVEYPYNNLFDPRNLLQRCA